MNFKTLLLLTLSTISASTPPQDGTFSQGGCSTNYTGPLKQNQLNLSYKCFTPTASGMCYAYHPSYHYNPSTGKCEFSVFGGCPDGCQAFRSQAQCEQECVKPSEPETPDSKRPFSQSQCKVEKSKNNKFEKLPAKCFIKTMPGKCRMAIKSYHLDVTSGKCIQSIFGGCDDGCRAFKSIKECQTACTVNSIDA